MRVERILKAAVVSCYRVEENNHNLVKCIMAKGLPKYVDLKTNKEVPALSVQVVEDVQKDDTALLSGKLSEGSFLSRPGVVFNQDQKEQIELIESGKEVKGGIDFGYVEGEGQSLATNEDQSQYKTKKKAELPVNRALDQNKQKKKPVKKVK